MYKFSAMALFGACVCLAACAGRPQPGTTSVVLIAMPTEVASPAPETSVGEPPATASSEITPVSARIDVNAAGASLRALTLRDLPALRNLSAGDLLARFGEPDFTRREASAEIWQYRGDSCVLDLFLYPSGDSLKVADAITRSRTDLDAPEDSCMPSGAPAASS